MAHLLDVLFGCSHKNYTFPITVRGRRGVTPRTYVVCLDCGKEFAYDWKEMKVVTTSRLPHETAALADESYAAAAK